MKSKKLKLKTESLENSPSSVLQGICQQWEQLQETKKFLPNDKVFDFRIKRKKGDSKRKFYRRQEELVREFVEGYLWFIERGERKGIKLIRKHCQVIADLFYQREDLKTGQPIQAIIVWANRGGGKSLIAAVVIYLCMVWKKLSFSDLAGSQDQAVEVYSYVTAFWECIPIIKERLLDGEPLMHKTKLKNKVSLNCIANSQSQVRGKHPEGLIADEVCQKESYKDDNVLAATNSVLTQDDFIILYISTFHLITGLFADTWRLARSLGFKKYKWNIYECSEKCIRKINCKKCRLTRRKIKKDPEGNIVKVRYFGCNGKARKADGWLSYQRIRKIKKKAEIRGDNWRVEFECSLAGSTKGKIYKQGKVQKSLVDRMVVPKEAKRAVGIDFGTSKQCAIVYTIMGKNKLLVPWSDMSVGKDLEYIAKTLDAMKKRYGDFIVYADSEQSYGIMYLRKAGYTVESVAFNKWKEPGIRNLERYFNSSRIKILNVKPNRILWKDLINYKRDDNGKIIKKNDHSPDALMLSVLAFDFVYYFGRLMKKEAAEDQLKEQAEEDAQVEVF